MKNDRYLHKIIDEMVFSGPKKMAFISGPRQSGKTTFARFLMNQRGLGTYNNWDQREFRSLWAKTPQKLLDNVSGSKETPIIVLDEIHKAKFWKRTLKGIFDTAESRVDIIVTGSARLDTFKKGGDSLLGRYFPFRLHPFTLAEVQHPQSQDDNPDTILQSLKEGPPPSLKIHAEILKDLMKFGGFPEPFFAQSERRARAWRRLRLQQLVREDLRDLTRIQDLAEVELLMALMPERAASQLSRSSLREDLEVAHTTVTRWLSYLEALYYHFEVKPYHRSIKRGLKKEGKLYLWDYSEVESIGHRAENLVAQHLLKACHYWTDAGYGNFDLQYLRNADQCEIDFLIVKDKKPFLPIEVKLNDVQPSPHWEVFLPQIPLTFGVQLVIESSPYLRSHKIAEKTVCVMDAARFLNLVL